ncbi:MAG: DUF58 domain-containing protein [Halieaceae bacterium]|nr:DUF58 domain-containing protein [Halieaceae bacterium]
MHLADITQPARGAYTAVTDLIALRFPARLLKLTRKNRALISLTGPNKSNFRGRGIDFEEVRRYQAGDDIRTIDWRVTARTGDAHTKLFREERERPVLLVVDQRNSMFFGSSHCFKSVLAAQLASLLAWSALDNGDRIGGLVFNGSEHRDIRPRRSRKTVLALLAQIDTYNSCLPLTNQNHDDSFADMLDNLRRIARPGSAIFLISDFNGAANPHAREHLFQLAQHTEITALSCIDPMEVELPRAGRYSVTNGTERSALHTAGKAVRTEFRSRYEARIELLSKDLQRLGIPLLQTFTNCSPFVQLQTYYGNPRH